jgi:Ni/Co efflux regulator RcnB
LISIKTSIAGAAIALLAAGAGTFATAGTALAATTAPESATAATTALVPSKRHWDGHDRWRDRNSCERWGNDRKHGRWHGDKRHWECRNVGGWWQFWED